jgi:hypothetical protein
LIVANLCLSLLSLPRVELQFIEMFRQCVYAQPEITEILGVVSNCLTLGRINPALLKRRIAHRADIDRIVDNVVAN